MSATGDRFPYVIVRVLCRGPSLERGRISGRNRSGGVRSAEAPSGPTVDDGNAGDDFVEDGGDDADGGGEDQALDIEARRLREVDRDRRVPRGRDEQGFGQPRTAR